MDPEVKEITWYFRNSLSAISNVGANYLIHGCRFRRQGESWFCILDRVRNRQVRERYVGEIVKQQDPKSGKPFYLPRLLYPCHAGKIEHICNFGRTNQIDEAAAVLGGVEHYLCADKSLEEILAELPPELRLQQAEGIELPDITGESASHLYLSAMWARKVKFFINTVSHRSDSTDIETYAIFWADSSRIAVPLASYGTNGTNRQNDAKVGELCGIVDVLCGTGYFRPDLDMEEIFRQVEPSAFLPYPDGFLMPWNGTEPEKAVQRAINDIFWRYRLDPNREEVWMKEYQKSPKIELQKLERCVLVLVGDNLISFKGLGSWERDEIRLQDLILVNVYALSKGQKRYLVSLKDVWYMARREFGV